MEIETLARVGGPAVVALLLLVAVRLAASEEPRKVPGRRSPSDPGA